MDLRGRLNPFSVLTSAEGIPQQDLPHLFEQPWFYPDLLTGRNKIVFGAKGSGKSTVLKILSAPLLLKRFEKSEEFLPFLGIRVDFSFETAKPWREAFEMSRSTELFEHFFAIEYIKRLLVSLPYLTLPSECTSQILQQAKVWLASLPDGGDPSRISTEPSALIALLDQESSLVINHVETRRSLDPARFGRPLRTIRDLIRLCRSLRETIATNTRFTRASLAILVDGYDFLGDLCTVFNPLLSKDLNEYMCVKIGALQFGEYVNPALWSGLLVRDRDFDVIPLRIDPKAGEYFAFFQGIANRAFETSWGQQVDVQAVLTDPSAGQEDFSDPKLQRLREHLSFPAVKTMPPRQRPYNVEYHGLSTVAALAAGNPYIFVSLMRRILDEERQNPTPGDLISAANQGRAIIALSQEYLENNTSWLGQEEGIWLRRFLWHALVNLQELFAGGKHVTNRFSVVDPEKLDDFAFQALLKGLRHGFLISNTEERLKSEYEPTRLPAEFSLAPILFPRFGLYWGNDDE